MGGKVYIPSFHASLYRPHVSRASGAADPWLKEVENWPANDLENIIESHRLGN
tara:strand:+ start:16343 stop:16501 length:159 start_codon:yes stop_codon:yes gene_type:complete